MRILKNYLVAGLIGFGSFNSFGQSPKIRESEAYSYIAERISFNDPELKNLSLLVTKDCPDDNKECKVNKIFNYVINNYKHIEHTDAESGLLKSPKQTIKDGGGDCKDLSILNNSLLENIGINTKLIFTKNHMYGLVCGMNLEKIKKEINTSIKELYWSYTINGETCISADPTTGYLGDINKNSSETRAIVDLLTKEMILFR